MKESEDCKRPHCLVISKMRRNQGAVVWPCGREGNLEPGEIKVLHGQGMHMCQVLEAGEANN